jgi:hypothetical protein
LSDENIGMILFGGYIGNRQLISENPGLKLVWATKSIVDFIDNFLRAQNNAMILVKVNAYAS